jgi:hypothetical protein
MSEPKMFKVKYFRAKILWRGSPPPWIREYRSTERFPSTLRNRFFFQEPAFVNADLLWGVGEARQSIGIV